MEQTAPSISDSPENTLLAQPFSVTNDVALIHMVFLDCPPPIMVGVPIHVNTPCVVVTYISIKDWLIMPARDLQDYSSQDYHTHNDEYDGVLRKTYAISQCFLIYFWLVVSNIFYVPFHI